MCEEVVSVLNKMNELTCYFNNCNDCIIGQSKSPDDRMALLKISQNPDKLFGKS